MSDQVNLNVPRSYSILYNIISGDLAGVNATLNLQNENLSGSMKALNIIDTSLTSGNLVKAGTDGLLSTSLAESAIVTLTGTQTLTNKTLTSPSLTTPSLGVASATSINKLAITPPATSATLTISDGKTLAANNSLTLAGTDSTVMTFPSTSDTVVTLGASQTLTNKTFASPSFTTPSLGVASATSINGLTITSTTGTLTLTNAKTLSVTNSLTFSGTDSTVMTFPSTSDTVVTLGATQTLTNKTLTSPTLTSPTMTAPSLGVATATSINKVTITQPVTSATLTISDGKTLAANNSLTLAGTDSTVMTFPSTSDTLVGLAATQTLTNKTLTSPSLTTPSLGVATATSINKLAITQPATSATLTIANGKTLAANNSLTFAGTDSTTMTFPGSSDTVVTLGASQTLTNKTLTSPTMTTPSLGVATATSINKLTITQPATSATLTIANGKTLAANNSLTFAGTDSTTMTFPSASDTVVGLAATQILTNKQLNQPQFIQPQILDIVGFSHTQGELLYNSVNDIVSYFDSAFAQHDFVSVDGTQTLTNKTLTSPTLTTPSLGVASATSINKLTITQPATSATLTISDGKTLAASNSLTFAGTDSTVMTFPSTSDTVVTLGASQTLTNKTLTSPSLTTPSLGVATATSLNKLTITQPATSATLTISDGKTLTASNSLTFAGTDSTTMTFPSSSDTVVTLGATQTLTNKTLTNPSINTINSLSLPTSSFVGLTDSQTLTNKTLTSSPSANITQLTPDQIVFNSINNHTTGAGLGGTSASYHRFTGSSNQSWGLPSALATVGQTLIIFNAGSANVTIYSYNGISQSTAVCLLTPGNGAIIVCIQSNPVSALGWDAFIFQPTSNANVVSLSNPTIDTINSHSLPSSNFVGTTDTQSLTNKTVNKLTITAPATSATLTIVDGKTLTANNSLTFSGTDSTTMTFPSHSSNIGMVPTLISEVFCFTAVGSNPTVGQTNAAQSPWTSSGNVIYNIQAENGDQLYVATSATNSYMAYSFGSQSAGIYTIAFFSVLNANMGKFDLQETTNSITLASGVDSYRPSTGTNYDDVRREYSFYHAGGTMNIKWLTTGKNANSQDYYVMLKGVIRLIQIG